MTRAPAERTALLAKMESVTHAARLMLLRGDPDALLRVAVNLAATNDLILATVHNFQAVIDDAAILLRTGRIEDATALLLRRRAAWSDRPKPAAAGGGVRTLRDDSMPRDK